MLPKGVKLQVDTAISNPNPDLNPKPKLKALSFSYSDFKRDLSETLNVPVSIRQQKGENQQSAPTSEPLTTVVEPGLPSPSPLPTLTVQKSSPPPPPGLPATLPPVVVKSCSSGMDNNDGDRWFQKLAFTLWTDTARCQAITNLRWDEMVRKFGHFYVKAIQGHEGEMFELVQDQEDYRSSKNAWCKDRCAMPRVVIEGHPRKKKTKKADGSVVTGEVVQQQKEAVLVVVETKQIKVKNQGFPRSESKLREETLRRALPSLLKPVRKSIDSSHEF
ncbi:hypothetical protein BGZ97_012577 [Linnemannia gamsii]|uniref:Uncharacterized protein n=1 Tax=Linnemannia gamsii TaxID=64522 RepID=A0A9P6UV30_9FUNG|nr:hypothetical protein BGZ97_012577 [Linnemannia gamsii]